MDWIEYTSLGLMIGSIVISVYVLPQPYPYWDGAFQLWWWTSSLWNIGILIHDLYHRSTSHLFSPWPQLVLMLALLFAFCRSKWKERQATRGLSPSYR